MKKLLILSVVAVGFAITACKKDRTCTCTTTTSGTFNFTVSGDTVFKDMSKSDAEAACDGLESSGSSGGESYETTCELK